MKKRLLEPLVVAIETAAGAKMDALRDLFSEVAKRRPDLLEKSLFAERSKRPSQIDNILRATIAELDKMEAACELPDGWDRAPYLSHYRINASTGRMHIGHGSSSVLLFT
ncbi:MULTISPECIES: hypothetical protein [unclassified Mesorhizobium]|uniref:hypothetical protein n=1 Tax=unclassified Mesorhizobium TaxID=325217 RepID=UPI0030156773